MPAAPNPGARFILRLDSPGVSLESAGGKGLGLALLVRAGHAVPEGFVVSSKAYTAHVRGNGLENRIDQALAAARLDNPDDLERCSREIRQLFAAGDLPQGLGEELVRAFRDLGSPPVAVRSSATAEDLPESSFAGQQETYLNVRGEPGLERALRDCWSSLWTARAIGYRARQGIRQGIRQDGLALAVVVQRMVESDVSGVMFTANPLTGLRREVVIDASLGLGEALVSGLVEPDHFEVDAAAARITSRRLGAKALVIRSRAEGGVETHRGEADPGQSLPDEMIVELAALGKRVEAALGVPQDIEWALADGRIHLLQSRPITSLFPVPPSRRHDPLRVYFSFGAVQGLLDPITPLGRDFLRQIFASGPGSSGSAAPPKPSGSWQRPGNDCGSTSLPSSGTRLADASPAAP